jgi:hypothetical protein
MPIPQCHVPGNRVQTDIHSSKFVAVKLGVLQYRQVSPKLAKLVSAAIRVVLFIMTIRCSVGTAAENFFKTTEDLYTQQWNSAVMAAMPTNCCPGGFLQVLGGAFLPDGKPDVTVFDNEVHISSTRSILTNAQKDAFLSGKPVTIASGDTIQFKIVERDLTNQFTLSVYDKKGRLRSVTHLLKMTKPYEADKLLNGTKPVLKGSKGTAP